MSVGSLYTIWSGKNCTSQLQKESLSKLQYRVNVLSHFCIQSPELGYMIIAANVDAMWIFPFSFFNWHRIRMYYSYGRHYGTQQNLSPRSRRSPSQQPVHSVKLVPLVTCSPVTCDHVDRLQSTCGGPSSARCRVGRHDWTTPASVFWEQRADPPTEQVTRLRTKSFVLCSLSDITSL